MNYAISSEIRPWNGPSGQTLDIEKIRSLVGKPSPLHEPHDEVSNSDIRHWCEVMRDRNPLYTDEEYAKNSKYGGIIAPPTMTQTWSLDNFKGAIDHFVHGIDPFEKEPYAQIMAILDEEGYTSVMATEQTIVPLKPVRPGDSISCTLTIESVSDYDHITRQGIGRYANHLYSFINQNEEEVGRLYFKVLKYKPPINTRALYEG